MDIKVSFPRIIKPLFTNSLLKVVIVPSLLILNSCEKPPTSIPTSRLGQKIINDTKWFDIHKKFCKQAESYQEDLDILWLGDSITEFWQNSEGKTIYSKHFSKYKMLNFAIRGDRIEHLLWRIKHGNLVNIYPKIIILNIGANNWMHSEKEIIQGINNLLHELNSQKPKSVVILHGIFPQGELSSDPVRAKLLKVNQSLQKIRNKNIRFVDLTSNFLNADLSLSREIMPDFLHLSKKGYAIWGNQLRPIIKTIITPR